MKYDPVSGDDTTMRQIPECKHDMLKKVHINGFFSTKSLVDLACHILEIGTSLQSLTLDTVFSKKEDSNIGRCSVEKTTECWPISRDRILGAHEALRVIERDILEKVPSTVKINIGKPCSRCHSIDVNQ